MPLLVNFRERQLKCFADNQLGSDFLSGSINHHPDDKLSVVAEKCATGFFILRYRPVSKDQKVSVVSIIFIKEVMTIIIIKYL